VTAPTPKRRKAKREPSYEMLLNIVLDLADTSAVMQAAEMEDPGRQPCFITTEFARRVVRAADAYRVPAPRRRRK
jgi:hypothetical protein